MILIAMETNPTTPTAIPRIKNGLMFPCSLSVGKCLVRGEEGGVANVGRRSRRTSIYSVSVRTMFGGQVHACEIYSVPKHT